MNSNGGVSRRPAMMSATLKIFTVHTFTFQHNNILAVFSKFSDKHKYGFSPVHSKIEPATANKKAPEGGSTKPWSQVVVKPGGWEYCSLSIS